MQRHTGAGARQRCPAVTARPPRCPAPVGPARCVWTDGFVALSRYEAHSSEGLPSWGRFIITGRSTSTPNRPQQGPQLSTHERCSTASGQPPGATVSAREPLVLPPVQCRELGRALLCVKSVFPGPRAPFVSPGQRYVFSYRDLMGLVCEEGRRRGRKQ